MTVIICSGPLTYMISLSFFHLGSGDIFAPPVSRLVDKDVVGERERERKWETKERPLLLAVSGREGAMAASLSGCTPSSNDQIALSHSALFSFRDG